MHQEQGSQSVESSDETDASTWKHSEALELNVLAKRRNKDDEHSPVSLCLSEWGKIPQRTAAYYSENLGGSVRMRSHPSPFSDQMFLFSLSYPRLNRRIEDYDRPKQNSKSYIFI